MKISNFNYSIKISMLLFISFQLINCSFLNKEEPKEAITYSDGRQESGLNFGLGSNGGYVVFNKKDFKDVIVENKLTKGEPQPKGPIERANEIPSTTDYYNGEEKLNTVRVDCKIYKDPKACTMVNVCGWCSNSNSCIAGNNLGPLESCPRSKYQFSFPGNVDNGYRIVNHNMEDLHIRTFRKLK